MDGRTAWRVSYQNNNLVQASYAGLVRTKAVRGRGLGVVACRCMLTDTCSLHCCSWLQGHVKALEAVKTLLAGAEVGGAVAGRTWGRHGRWRCGGCTTQVAVPRWCYDMMLNRPCCHPWPQDDAGIQAALLAALRQGPDPHLLSLDKCTGCKACGGCRALMS